MHIFLMLIICAARRQRVNLAFYLRVQAAVTYYNSHNVEGFLPTAAIESVTCGGAIKDGHGIKQCGLFIRLEDIFAMRHKQDGFYLVSLASFYGEWKPTRHVVRDLAISRL